MSSEATDESPEMDEDGGPTELQQQLRRANEVHKMLVETKSWALTTAREIEQQATEGRAEGDLDEDEYQMLFQQADYIRSVYRRIDHGDNTVGQIRSDF